MEREDIMTKHKCVSPSARSGICNKESENDYFSKNLNIAEIIRNECKSFPECESTIIAANNDHNNNHSKFDDSVVNEIVDFLVFNSSENSEQDSVNETECKIKFGRLNSDLISKLAEHPCTIQPHNEMNHYLREKCDSYYTKRHNNCSPNMINIIDEYISPPSLSSSITDYSPCITEEDPKEGALAAKLTPLSTNRAHNGVVSSQRDNNNQAVSIHPQMARIQSGFIKVEPDGGDESLAPESFKSSIISEHTELIEEYQEIIENSIEEVYSSKSNCEMHYFSSSSEVSSKCDTVRGIVTATNTLVSQSIIQDLNKMEKLKNAYKLVKRCEKAKQK